MNPFTAKKPGSVGTIPSTDPGRGIARACGRRLRRFSTALPGLLASFKESTMSTLVAVASPAPEPRRNRTALSRSRLAGQEPKLKRPMIGSAWYLDLIEPSKQRQLIAQGDRWQLIES